MATVTMTITDNATGGIDVKLESDPPFPNRRAAADAPPPTPAHHAGLLALSCVDAWASGGPPGLQGFAEEYAANADRLENTNTRQGPEGKEVV